MSDNGALYATTLCTAVFLAFIWNGRRNGAKLPLPPGPKGLPLLGNVLDVPRGVPIWKTFTTMAKMFSTRPFYPLSTNIPLKQPIRR
jgi:hypothetical protein